MHSGTPRQQGGRRGDGTADPCGAVGGPTAALPDVTKHCGAICKRARPTGLGGKRRGLARSWMQLEQPT